MRHALDLILLQDWRDHLSSRHDAHQPLMSLLTFCQVFFRTWACSSVRQSLTPDMHSGAQAWFAVHGPLLQRSAAKDSLWHRVLSALAPPTAGDIARGMVQKSGNAKIVMRHAFRNFKTQCNKVVFIPDNTEGTGLCSGKPVLICNGGLHSQCKPKWEWAEYSRVECASMA